MIRLIRINTQNTVPIPRSVFNPAFCIFSPKVYSTLVEMLVTTFLSITISTIASLKEPFTLTSMTPSSSSSDDSVLIISTKSPISSAAASQLSIALTVIGSSIWSFICIATYWLTVSTTWAPKASASASVIRGVTASCSPQAVKPSIQVIMPNTNNHFFILSNHPF